MIGDLVLCVGEPLVVLSPPPGVRLERCDELAVSVGGAETNVAVHLARLGVPTRFAGAVGADPFGRRVRAVLSAAGVDVSALETDPNQSTGIYAKDPAADGTVPYYYRQGSAMSVASELAKGALDGVGHVHTTGVLAALSGESATLVDELLVAGTSVSFDVNYRPALWRGRDAGSLLAGVAGRADVVFVGRDEAGELWDCRDAKGVRALLPDVELVVKDADGPAMAFSGDERVEVPALEVDIVEPVGAGDGFAAGYLSVRCRGGDIATALRTGHVVAASALTARGDQGEAPAPALLQAAASGEGWPHAAA